MSKPSRIAVLAGAASGSHPVRGVADQERVALSKSLGEADPEDDRHRTLDLDRQPGLARRLADPPLHPPGGERLEVRRPHRPKACRTSSGPACRRG
jgi:hypothetical protein